MEQRPGPSPRSTGSRRERSLIIALVLTLLLGSAPSAGAADTEPAFRLETITGPDGVRMSRTVLQGPVSAAGPTARGLAPAQVQLGDILWIDSNDQAAIPEHIAMSGDGLHVFAGWWLNNQRASHYATTGDSVPTWTKLLQTEYEVPVSVSYAGEIHLTQDADSTSAVDSLRVLDAAGAALFTKPYPPHFEPRAEETHAYVATDDAGTVVASVAWDPSTTARLIESRDTATGDTLWTVTLNEAVNGLDLSSDGSVLAVTLDQMVILYDALSGMPFDTLATPAGNPWPAAISGDGEVVVAGGFSPEVRVFRRITASTQYALDWTYNTLSTFVTAVDVSDDGSTVLAGTLTNSVPPTGSLFMFDATTPTPLWVLSSFGDAVSSVALTADGYFGVAGSWGRQGGTFGSVLVMVGRDFWYPTIFEIADDAIATVASVLDVAVSDDGLYLAASAKAVHARELGNGGAVLAVITPAKATATPPDPELRPTFTAYRLLPARPNPAVLSSVISFRAPPAGGPVDLAIYDARGRRVRQLVSARSLRGWQETTWDGLDEAGRPAPAGVYFSRLSGTGFTATEKILLAR